MSDRIEFDIPESQWLTANQRLHWAEKARRTRFLRTLARLEARRQHLLPSVGPVWVVAEIQYPGTGRADPANANPTVKALIDGLTDAGIWPDDDSKHLIGPDFRRKPGRAPKGMHRITLHITDQYVPF